MYHSREDYQKVDEMAIRLRIDYNHLEKCLDVFKLAKQLNITLIKYSSLNKKQLDVIKSCSELEDACTFFCPNSDGSYSYYTYYNDLKGEARIRLTIAHEIKHVVFEEKNPTDKDEELANHFARYILAPTFLVMEYVNKQKIIQDIMFDFDISYEAALNAFRSADRRITKGKAKLEEFEKEFTALQFSEN